MTKHIVTLKEIQTYTVEQQLCASADQWSHKKIVMLIPAAAPNESVYRVFNNREMILETSSIRAAIKAYNKEP
jgi:hypothetical protein